MSVPKSKAELIEHKEQALSVMDKYITSLISSDSPELQGKSDKLSYWLTDYVRFLEFEPNFSSSSLRRYKRGEIIKVHLGFNIGSEEGGLHYAVVVEKNNPKSSSVITVVPLTSVKEHVDVNNLKGGSIFLGNEIYTSLSVKIKTTASRISDELNSLREFSERAKNDSSQAKITSDILDRIYKCEYEMQLLNKMRNEFLNMKKGSIALIGQITTISKIRIYDPKTDHDILSNIKLSNEKLDMIDKAILERFTK